jgi:hypothetical protein
LILLYEPQESAKISGTTTVPLQTNVISTFVSYGTNAAQNFFALRPEPKPLTVPNVSQPLSRGRELRELHKAGGYDHANYERRNWTEIFTQMGLQV